MVRASTRCNLTSIKRSHNVFSCNEMYIDNIAFSIIYKPHHNHYNFSFLTAIHHLDIQRALKRARFLALHCKSEVICISIDSIDFAQIHISHPLHFLLPETAEIKLETHEPF